MRNDRDEGNFFTGMLWGLFLSGILAVMITLIFLAMAGQ
jgi:hypothetical protein